MKAALDSSNVPYKYVNNMTSKQREELRSLAGKTSVPQGFVHGIAIGGCNDGARSWQGIKPMLRSGRLQKALAMKGQGHDEIMSVLT